MLLEPGRTYELGRAAQVDLSVPWDRHISRRHAKLTPHADFVEVEKLPGARHQLFYLGAETQAFQVRPDEHFVVGGTTFYVVPGPREPSSQSAQPVEELTFDRKDLQKV